MLKKKKLTRKVWYENQLWKVRKVISPNRDQDFLLLERAVKGIANSDGSDCMEMICIESQNDIWYPNTKKVKAILEKKKELQGKLEELENKESNELTTTWLNVMEPSN